MYFGCVSRHREGSAVPLCVSRSSQLSSPPACRICCLLTFVRLQTARFPRRLGKKPITADVVCSLGHRRRPYPLCCCCAGCCLCRWLPPTQPASVGRRPGAPTRYYLKTSQLLLYFTNIILQYFALVHFGAFWSIFLRYPLHHCCASSKAAIALPV